ncbi:MAG: hypothetical protein SF051_15075 [Elusimicrobiota bacterium]|nr:hypothetical protein [Elusimicrobiota bacterium]
MADIVIRLDLRLGATAKRTALAAALLLSVVPELGSESVTLSTYYPAPSGVYTNMITTGNTYLARDGGNVGVGTSGPTAKLHVNGTTTLGGNVAVNGSAVALDVSQNTAIRVGQSYLSSGGNYMHLANNEYYNGGAWVASGGAGALLQFSGQQVAFYTHNGAGAHSPTMVIAAAGNVTMYNDLNVNGRMDLTASKAEFTGVVVARGQNACTTAHVRSYLTTGTTACPGGTYATFNSGVMSKYVMMPRYTDVSGLSANAWMLCCPCPGGVCPSL